MIGNKIIQLLIIQSYHFTWKLFIGNGIRKHTRRAHTLSFHAEHNYVSNFPHSLE
jgi:hypothetical protein